MLDRSRRYFMKEVVVGAAAYGLADDQVRGAAAGDTGGSRLQKVGVELYTVRNIILNDPAQVLNTLAAIGFREAEVIWTTLDRIWPALSQTQLKPVSIHMDAQLFEPGKGDQLEAALHKVKECGFNYVVYPAVSRPNRDASLDFFEALADRLNQAGKKCRTLGMQLCYHNHAFDFKPIGSTTPVETLLSRTSPETLALEVDVFWVSVAGHDPVEFLKEHNGRVPLVHLKNKTAGLPVQFNETVPAGAFREVGNGSLDIGGILRAAMDIGARHFFVEQDQTPGDPIASLRESYTYLDRLRF